MKIWNDGPGRIVFVTHEQAYGGDPFAATTRLGQAIGGLLGVHVGAVFASAGILPVDDRRSMPRHVYGHDARDELAERRVVVVGREAAQLLLVPEEPLLIWMPSRWRYVGGEDGARVLAPLTTAAFPMPGPRTGWWRDGENVEVARQWLEEQRGGS